MSLAAVEDEISSGQRLGIRSEFDGLRGLAILGVVFYHYFPNWLRASIIGVDAFFVLSGFLIMRLMLEEHHKYGSISLRDFFTKRFARLLPGIWLVVVVMVPAAYVRLSPDGFRRIALGALGAVTFTTNWMQVAGMSIGLRRLWSIALEQQFYLIWPFVVLLLGVRIRRIRNVCMILVPLAVLNILLRSLAGVRFEVLYRSFDTRGVLYLLSGVLLATVLPAAATFQSRQLLLTALLVIGVAGRAWLVTIPDRSLYERVWGRGGDVLTVLLMVVVVIAAKDLRWFGVVLRWRPLRWLGTIAYSLFLWHQPGEYYDGLERMVDQLWLRNIILFVVSLAVAALANRFVEQPARAWIRRRFGVSGRVPVATAEVAPSPLAAGGG